jgi:hypothetical protein
VTSQQTSLESSPSAATSVAAPRRDRSLTLPPPPDDNEKYAYIDRNLPYLTITLIVSAACLTVS